jgi:hypothetical protein
MNNHQQLLIFTSAVCVNCRQMKKGQLEILNKKTLVYCLKNNKIKLTDFHQ